MNRLGNILAAVAPKKPSGDIRFSLTETGLAALEAENLHLQHPGLYLTVKELALSGSSPEQITRKMLRDGISDELSRQCALAAGHFQTERDN